MGSVDPELQDYDNVKALWGADYTMDVQGAYNSSEEKFKFVSSLEEMAATQGHGIFGMHNVFCGFHKSGPCTLEQVEEGVARSWNQEPPEPGLDGAGSNFSTGYVPLMDNNMMLWTESIGPLLDAFLADGVSFYPMVWESNSIDGDGADSDYYSVLVSPCGKQLVEVAAKNNGGRGIEQFFPMALPRAVFTDWNVPVNFTAQPLLPLRISRAVGRSRFNDTLAFYGAGPKGSAQPGVAALGFGRSVVLADATDPATGDRAVTLKLSAAATVHLQLWSKEEPDPPASPPLPSLSVFEAASAAGNNQINLPINASTNPFCSSTNEWTVEKYNDYISLTHQTVMSAPPTDPATRQPPAGNSFDVFIDDHFSWDCTAPTCDMAAAAEALYAAGHRIQWIQTPLLGSGWAQYTHDPSGWGIELHWFNMNQTPPYVPTNPVPGCFGAFASNGTCPGAVPKCYSAGECLPVGSKRKDKSQCCSSKVKDERKKDCASKLRCK